MLRTLFPLLFLLTGCTQVYKVNTTPYTMSTNPLAADGMEVVGEVSGRYCNSVIVFFPITQNPAKVFDKMMADAKEKGATAVVDVRLEPVDYLVVPFYGKVCYELSGTAVKPAAPPAPPPPPPPPPPPAKKGK